jgi:putative transcriptional regulator
VGTTEKKCDIITRMKNITLKNHFLVATPALKNSVFSKAVIYLYEHSEEGSMGLVINKPLSIDLENVLKHLDIGITAQHVGRIPVLMGGPIGQEHGFVIYEQKDPAESEKIIISASKETLRKIAKGKGPERFLVMLGYSGWDAGQLEEELIRNDWVIAPFDLDLLFQVPIDERWKKAAQLIGFDITKMSDFSGNA